MAKQPMKNIPAPPPPPGTAADRPVPPAPPPAPDPLSTETQSQSTIGQPPEPLQKGEAMATDTQKGNIGDEHGTVTTDAEAKGAVSATDALDRDGDGASGGSLPKDEKKRADMISRRGFEDGREAELRKDGTGRAPKAKPKDWTDGEYSRYTASHERGIAQRQANEMSDDDRLRRVEGALGLLSPERDAG